MLFSDWTKAPLIWEQPVAETLQERRVTSAGEYYNGRHVSGAARISFLTRAAAETCVAALLAEDATASTFSECPFYVDTIRVESGVAVATRTSKGTIQARLNGDGISYDVSINVDYDNWVQYTPS